MSDKKIVMNLEAIMGDRFGKYSKYIIQERALPDVCPLLSIVRCQMYVMD